LGRRVARASNYLNLVVALTTELSVDSLRGELRAIEALAGRARTNPAVVELDLDLLLYGRRVDAERKLPRPGLFALPFTLVPLAELEPGLTHPVTGESCRSALRQQGGGSLDNLGQLTALA
jgi:2-amino-4-hydroxy-6-hydroxymethyldihydropteridine diphosphokinase